jgi:hypothetical protein
MKQPPEVVYTGLHGVIGNPTDYSNNKQNQGFDRRVDLRIPTHESHQRKPAKVGPNNMLLPQREETTAPSGLGSSRGGDEFYED